MVRRRLARRGQTRLLGGQHQLLPPFCIVEACLPYVVKTVEGLDVTLDNLAGLRRWILIDRWM